MAAANRTYEPSLPPNVDPENDVELRAFTSWILQELRSVANMMRNPIIPRLHAEPEKPTDGLLVLADGSDWDPGSGRGLYYLDDAGGGTWVFVA